MADEVVQVALSSAPPTSGSTRLYRSAERSHTRFAAMRWRPEPTTLDSLGEKGVIAQVLAA